MAAPSEADMNNLIKVLNLNQTDSQANTDIIHSYFGERTDEEDSSSDEDDEFTDCDDRSTDDHVNGDLAERIVPLERGNILQSIPAADSPVLAPTSSDRLSTPPCKCVLNNGRPCYTVFYESEVEDFRLQYMALTREELDMAILAKLACHIRLDPLTRRPKQSQQTERKSSRTDYFHHGYRICRDFFKFIHGIGQDKLNALIKHYKANGLESRTHKNKKKQPHNALKFIDKRMVIDFIINFSEVHAIKLPGGTPKNWITNVKLLPTHFTKKLVYDEYVKAAEESNVRIVQPRTFRDLWQKLAPFIRTVPPASDLCWVCQEGTMKVTKSANKSDEEKAAINQELHRHQEASRKEREFYQQICKEVKDQMPAVLPSQAPAYCSFDGKNHVSFDFAQQVHFPFNPLQPGPIYFKTPRKCGIFGLNCEPRRKQVNILIDEAHCSGKGANAVISYLHHYLENYGIGEKYLYLHADNCSGQNKNSTMVWYLIWRCINNRHKRIQISFLITGHTKFSPDGGFGLLKRKYRKTKVDCLSDIKNLVDASSEMNDALLVGTENGPTIVPTYDWANFFIPYFNKVKSIKKFHHFIMNDSGSFICKEDVDSVEEQQFLVKKNVTVPSNLPPLIKPPGLSAQRQQYLYKEIRPFVDEKHQDTVAPKPHLLGNENILSDDDKMEESPEHVEPIIIDRNGQRGRGRGRGRGYKRKLPA